MKLSLSITLVVILVVIGQRVWPGHQEDKFNDAVAAILASEGATKVSNDLTQPAVSGRLVLIVK